MEDARSVLATASPISRRALLQRAAAAGLTIPAVGMLAACGDSGGSGGGAGPASGTVRMIKGPFMAKNSDETKLFEKLSRPFAREHPSIDVQYSYYDWATYQTTLTTQFAGDHPPDLPYLTIAVWPLFASKGALMDLSDRVHADGFKEQYGHTPEALWASGTYQDKIYGVPWIGNTFPILVNTTLLEQADVDPATWNASYDSMRAAAKAVTRGDVHGFAIAGTSFKTFSYQFWLPFLWGAGADLFNEDRTAGGMDTDEAGEAFDFLASLYKDGYATPAGQYDLAGFQAQFTAGRIAILHINAFVIDVLLKDKKRTFEFDVYSPPPGPAGPSPLLVDYGYLTLAEKAQAPDAAWEYLRFLASPPFVAPYADTWGPTLLTARDDTPRKGADAPQYRHHDELVRQGRAYPAHPKGVDALRAASDQFELCIGGKKGGRQAVRDANDAIDKLLAS